MLTLDLQHTLHHTHAPTPRTLATAALFGLTLEAQTTTALIPPTTLTLKPNQIIFITGTSGGGKSTLLRCITRAIHDRPDHAQPMATLLTFDPHEPLPDAALVDSFADLIDGNAAASSASDADLTGTLRWLGLAGLSDAWLLLARPRELSEGQRHRLHLARLIARVESAAPRAAARGEASLCVVVADEFLTPLDRITASAVTSATARWARRAGVCFIAATAHDDLLEALGPDVLIDASPSGITLTPRAQ